MKNIKSSLLSIALIFNLFSLAACNNVQPIPEKTSEPTTSHTVEQVTPKPSEEKSNEIEITLSIYNINKEAI
jgi:hypothetical protein